MTAAVERVAQLLRVRGAAAVERPGGTLDAHLEGVQHRLAALGASSALQLAGRAHAVYGTDGFDVALLSLDERPLHARGVRWPTHAACGTGSPIHTRCSDPAMSSSSPT